MTKHNNLVVALVQFRKIPWNKSKKECHLCTSHRKKIGTLKNSY